MRVNKLVNITVGGGLAFIAFAALTNEVVFGTFGVVLIVFGIGAAMGAQTQIEEDREYRQRLIKQSIAMDIEVNAKRMQGDPVSALAMETAAAEFDKWVYAASKPQKGIAFKFGRMIGSLLR